MTKKDEHLLPEDEQVLDFEEAKEMTVGQAVRKHGELQAGVTEEDGLLDRYIKQHRKDIEAEKFETQQLAKKEMEAALKKAEKEAAKKKAALEKAEKEAAALAIHKLEKAAPAELPEWEEEHQGLSLKKQLLIWSVLAVTFVGVLVTAYLWTKQETTPKSTTSTSTSSTTTSSSKKEAADAAFTKLYATFFVDKEQTKLKNSHFDKLGELKALLDKLPADSEGYKKSKEKYDRLEKAIKAIQDLNGKFDKPVIVDGRLDTTATVKPDVTLEAVATGLSEVDAEIASAVTFGRSQQQAAASSASAQVASQATNTEAGASQGTTEPAVTAPTGTTGSLYGIAAPAGVALQRDVSRVAYDQAKIDDAGNPAWVFEDGVLETIISISQQRGYVSGNDYILEKVTIVNGNGYYNLFKPDGTYLFTINCKTGYFVGNGAGNADALDF